MAVPFGFDSEADRLIPYAVQFVNRPTGAHDHHAPERMSVRISRGEVPLFEGKPALDHSALDHSLIDLPTAR